MTILIQCCLMIISAASIVVVPGHAFAPSLPSMGTATTSFSPSIAQTPALAAVSQSTNSDDSVNVSRREMMTKAVGVALPIAVAGVFNPTVAVADGRPMYLTEPTDEFKANEAKAMEFKRQQLAIKKEFTAILDKLLAEPNDEDALVGDLKALKAVIAKTGGLPLGIKKDELYKIIRSKKAKGFWPTNVEIAYQSLQQEISYQQNPNLEKDLGNPYQ